MARFMREIAAIVVLLGLAGPSLVQARPPAETLREAPGLRPGMTVLDRRGQRIGVILRTDQTRAGRPAVLVQANGARYTIGDAELRRTRHGERVIVKLTRSELRTRAILNAE
jgi:hypothetical protein